MAVKTVYGMTQSGKTYHTNEAYIKPAQRVLVFDPPASRDFDNYDKLRLNNADDVMKAFKKYSKKSSYKIVVRPDRNPTEKLVCDRLITLACALGRTLGRYNEENRVLLVVDEADVICSSHSQSSRVQHVVNKGRHDNVDSIFIARIPQRLHTDIRFNSSEIICFQLPNIPKDFKDNFGKDALRIKKLGFRHRFEWDYTGKMAVFNEKGKQIWSYSNDSN